jgi:uncharacterized protein (TIGR02145 family)
MKIKKSFRSYSYLLIGLFVLTLFACSKKSEDEVQPIVNPTMTDIDGNVYHSVKIGTQYWTVENLKTTRYRNGDTISFVPDSLQWSTLITEAYCNVLNDANNASVYGRFYNWYAVTDSRNLAPAGWHIPSDAEWTTLMNYLGTNAGGMLKETGTTHWNTPNTGATNSTGFTGRAAGDRSYTGLFHYIGEYACWWCTTQYSTNDAWEYVLRYNSSGYTRMSYSKGLGLNVRCVKD